MDIQSLDQETMEEIKRRLVKTYHPQEIYLLEPKREDSIDINILVVVNNIYSIEIAFKGRMHLKYISLLMTSAIPETRNASVSCLHHSNSLQSS